MANSLRLKHIFGQFSVVLGVILIIFALILSNQQNNVEPLRKRAVVGSYGDLLADTQSQFDNATISSFGRRAFDGTCSASTPCSNGACCASSGFCGYGPDYCGDSCLSNCDAYAECGQYSNPADKECPLSVCCSQFGFCGTTEDFCNDECQSNCVEHPEPSGDTGKVFDRVIGYYEGWNARSNCHETKPEDLPLGALTHINFAFAFVDPDTYEITPMDSATPADLFSQTTALKIQSPGLKVFISVGGWTFSDNGTVTQPLLGEIARDSAKRDKFANNVLNFLNHYGFDGIDIDWEYPGAPDRGGKDDDTENMVKMFAAIRSAFDASGRDLEMSFTIPASYWYLKWFDVPGLLKYADWTNLMSYDIHGIWDKENEIGNVAQPHTNLTEIKLAAELLWRVGVSPAQVSLGFGFYGRSFTLQDPSCNTPGCAFSDAANPGVCTNTGGYLAYYEVQDILTKNPEIQVQHDEEAAVKYFSWNTNQWISYDDEETFKQKTDWGNDIGFGGSLIWASDLDDYTWTAHAGFLGKKIDSNEKIVSDVTKKLLQQEAASITSAHLNEDCYRFSECVDLDIENASRCRDGYKRVGWDLSVCKGIGAHFGQPICCNTKTAPESCIWRGGGSDCNGQCHEGEVTLYKSGDGGWPTESNDDQCNRGYKYFCCSQNNWSDLTDQCYWTGCGGSCKDGEQDVAFAENLEDKCTIFNHGMHYCCKTRDPPLENCHWVGQGDCADNTCADTEVTLKTNNQGDSIWGCNWGRNKALCCTVNDNITPSVCDEGLCKSDGDISCDVDPYADDFSDEDQCDPADCFEDDSDASKRDIVKLGYSLLEKRGEKRPYDVDITLLGILYIIRIWSRRYPGSSHLHDSTRGPSASTNVFRPSIGTCSTTSIEVIARSFFTAQEIIDGYDTEHNPDLQWMRDLVRTLGSGVLPNGDFTATPPIPMATLQNFWNDPVLPPGMPRAGNSRGIRKPNDYMFDRFGSQGNRLPMLLAERNMNQLKGRLFDDEVAPQEQGTFSSHLEETFNTGTGEYELLEPIRLTIAVFRYINHPLARPTIQRNRRELLEAARQITLNVPQLANLHALVQEFDFNWYRTRADAARNWAAARILEITAMYNNAENEGNLPANAAQVRAAINSLYNDLTYIQPPPEDPDDD